MNDWLDDGTSEAHRRLVYAVICRAVRDADPNKSTIPIYCYKDAWHFLRSPEADDFLAGWDINLNWIKNNLERRFNGSVKNER